MSGRFYTHFSLLKTLEAGFRLPCLNHACDANVYVMADLFQERRLPSLNTAVRRVSSSRSSGDDTRHGV